MLGAVAKQGEGGMLPAARTVLIVDDDQATCGLLVDFLTEEGYRVECAAQGRAALTRVAAGGVDLVLLDWRLPDMSGAAVLEGLRTYQQPVPIVVLSAGQFAAPDLPPGAAAIVPKPFELEDLLAVLRRHCPLPPG